ncbi:DUF4136 domain-containing protein [Pontibacter fetidus]|uniref:DUF4136 domain-containing protein n=1 Tax=Pontibacter fetidus TaxID=2700082 RepID=A0A6B2HAY1_9BACT|nr:DUF4136 domain-containing protein [Pontibacter fetidus]NDK56952.1 DUF4136 domain-containing protein [Pontibacter fetidus]
MHQATSTSLSILRQALPWFLLLLLTNCTVGPEISSTYNRSANFRSYQTYAWHKAELPTPTMGNGPAYSPLLDQQLKQAIESELVKEGLRPDEENPDLLIAYDIALSGNQATGSDTDFAPGFGYGYSYWYGYRYRYNTTALPDYKSVTQLAPGTLIIDLIDANTNDLVWRGWHPAEIDPTTSGGYDINKAVANIMSRYPPVPTTIQ